MAILRFLAAVLPLLPHGVISTPVDSGQKVLEHPTASQPKLHGKFLHITDLHPDEFYKVHSSTEETVACHREKGPAGTYGAETSDCDSPFALINATFDWIAANLANDIDFVIWTGDSARHDSDEEIPRSPAQVLGTNRWIADKFAEVFADPKDAKNLMRIPVIPTLGNNDILPHNILLPGPNRWLQYYTDVWKRFIPEEQRHSFEFGGWFYVEVIPNKLAVVSLNTLYFFDRNAGVDDCVQPSEPGFKQMEWLRVQLQLLRERGMKAILMGHVPPARTDSKQNWDETCWQKYTLWLNQYRDVVTGSVYGHMNIDHFFVQDSRDIDYDRMAGGEGEVFKIREAMEDELSIESTADYLQELRDDWAKIPKPDVGVFDEEEVDSQGHKKKKKKKKNPTKDLGGKWAERYQLSLISPSVVPNYFPTLRVVEYNISGLENAASWKDSFSPSTSLPDFELQDALHEELKRDFEEAKKKKKGKKGDKKKPKKPKDPFLVIPNPPAKTSPPGPAYSPQPLTFVGYTQYYANLTYINNDMTVDNISADRWRDGIHRDKEPKSNKPKPNPFEFQIEYSTFTDKIYKLNDLTVKSYVKLAYRIGQQKAGGKASEEDFDDEDEEEEEEESLENEESGSLEPDSESDGDLGTEGKKHKKHGKHDKKKKKKKKQNKVWFHFLSHAFVKSVPKKDLKEIGS